MKNTKKQLVSEYADAVNANNIQLLSLEQSIDKQLTILPTILPRSSRRDVGTLVSHFYDAATEAELKVTGVDAALTLAAASLAFAKDQLNIYFDAFNFTLGQAEGKKMTGREQELYFTGLMKQASEIIASGKTKATKP